MKRMNLRKALSAGILVGATAVAASAVANPPQGNSGPDYGMGPGMMGGYGPGYGMGPGMMGGWLRLRHGPRHDGRLRYSDPI